MKQDYPTLIGQQFEYLTVIKQVEKPAGAPAGRYWLCQCKCGNTAIVSTSDLRCGRRKSCGCLSVRYKAEDFTNKRMGKLTVIRRAEDYVIPSGDHIVQWLCRCDCGKEIKLTAQKVREGKTLSCGCDPYLIINKTFGRLTVLYRAKDKEKKGSGILYHCRCSCGKERDIPVHNLISGATKSCGCLSRELAKQRATKYTGLNSSSKLYGAWHNMLTRCLVPENSRYYDYGGRGITVCEEWKDFNNFKEWSLKNGYVEGKGLSIDRINNNGNYEPLNCRWIPLSEQSFNKRSNKFITYNNETMTMKEWSLKLGINYDTLRNRFKEGWPIEKALTEPVHKRPVKIKKKGDI